LGLESFEAPGVEPVFPEQRQAISYAENRAPGRDLPTSPYTRFTSAATSVSISTSATRFIAMVFLLVFHLYTPTRAPYGKVAREGNCRRRSTLIQSTLESISLVT